MKTPTEEPTGHAHIARRNRWLPMVLAGVAALATPLLLKVKSSPSDQAAQTERAIADIKQENMRALLPYLQALSDQLNQARPPAATDPRTKEDKEREIARTLSEAFAKMYEVGRMINRDELRDEIMDRLLTQEGSVQMAVHIAADWEYAQTLFGEEQALARVSAIRLLKRAAERGNALPIEDAMGQVGERMNASDQWEKGIQQDYTALIAAYVNTRGVDAFLADPGRFFEKVGLTERTALEVERGLFDSKLRGVPPNIWREKLGRYFAPFEKASGG